MLVFLSSYQAINIYPNADAASIVTGAGIILGITTAFL
jgi:hypothetical protein